MNNATVERPVTEKNQDFAALMAEVATLEPQQQEKLTFFVQGYVAAAAGMNDMKKERPPPGRKINYAVCSKSRAARERGKRRQILYSLPKKEKSPPGSGRRN